MDIPAIGATKNRRRYGGMLPTKGTKEDKGRKVQTLPSPWMSILLELLDCCIPLRTRSVKNMTLCNCILHYVFAGTCILMSVARNFYQGIEISAMTRRR